VVVTVVGIGFLIYWIVPGIPLIPAFALAAVLADRCRGALRHRRGRADTEKIMGILQGRR
jgi:CPA1 family monovalent cation:H+ antiporter